MADTITQAKWDKLAPRFDGMASKGAEARWKPFKQALFSHMRGKILFLALGTGLDIPFFPKRQDITAIDISPKMIEQAEPKIAAYDGTMPRKSWTFTKCLSPMAASTRCSPPAPSVRCQGPSRA